MKIKNLSFEDGEALLLKEGYTKGETVKCNISVNTYEYDYAEYTFYRKDWNYIVYAEYWYNGDYGKKRTNGWVKMERSGFKTVEEAKEMAIIDALDDGYIDSELKFDEVENEFNIDTDIAVGDILTVDDVWDGEYSLDNGSEMLDDGSLIGGWAHYLGMSKEGNGRWEVNIIWKYLKTLKELLPEFDIEYDELDDNTKDIVDKNLYGSFLSKFSSWDSEKKIPVQITEIELLSL